MIKQKWETAAALIAYFIFLPYLSRIGGGMVWVAQYIPPPDKLVFGLLFFAVFSAIPGVVLAAFTASRKAKSLLPLLFAFLVMSALTIYFHHDYDLAADAQAAIGLVVAPFYVTVVGVLVYLFVTAVNWLWHRRSQ